MPRFSRDQLAAETDVTPERIKTWVRRKQLPRAFGRGSTRYYTEYHRDRIVRTLKLREQQRTISEIAEYLEALTPCPESP